MPRLHLARELLHWHDSAGRACEHCRVAEETKFIEFRADTLATCPGTPRISEIWKTSCIEAAVMQGAVQIKEEGTAPR